MSSSGSEQASKALFDAASTFIQLGFSAIPIQGDRDPDNPKAAAIDWKPFQVRYASPAELRDWFFRRHAGGMALVTGKISRLVVLDFDDPRLAAEFTTRYSDLCDTRIIRSSGRDLPHIYFRMPVGVTLPSRRLSGLDVQSDGRYIVSPPTTIAGAPYRVQRGGMPRILSRSDLDRIQRFIDEVAGNQATVSAVAEPVVQVRMRTPDECRHHYRLIAQTTGRNHALFRTALLMRDTGWRYEEALALMQPLHVALIRPGERPAQREREAHATIRSAFSRPARKPVESSAGLPNSLREYLIRAGKTALARVLEGLMAHGVPIGALLTEKSILETLGGLVGRYSVLQALRETLENAPVFERASESAPFPRPHTLTDVASGETLSKEKNCSQIGVTASDKNRGRPAARYVMPCVAALCQRLGVAHTASDPLQASDLASAAQYRRGMHRELIKRRPGRYHVRLLARRLNVTERTCQRYNRACGVRLTPTYDRHPIHTGMMHLLAAPTPAMFIEDARGKRYPCRVEVASWLLEHGGHPRLCIQGFNHYTHPDGAYEAPALSQPAKAAPADPASVFYVPPAPAAARPTAPVTTSTQSAPEAVFPGTQVLPAVHPVRSFRRPLADVGLEAAALRLYHHLRELTALAPQCSPSRLSMATARRLAVEYGAMLLARCQTVIHTRHNIHNYAGFVISFLRSETAAQRLAKHLSL